MCYSKNKGSLAITTTENAAANIFTVEKTIHHVLGTCSWIIDRVTQLETQVKEIHTISNN